MIANWLLLGGAGFLAGVLNTLAGGGTFLTLPALIYAGVPAISANATSAVAVFPGYLTGALGFRDELLRLDRPRLLKLCAVTAVGGFIGAMLLLASSKQMFASIIPFLLLLATFTFAFREKIQALAKCTSVTDKGAFVGAFLVSVYGGYFNGGLGIMLLALFSLWGIKDVHLMNGLKSGLSFTLSASSVLVFVAAGLVAWNQALLMMATAAIGGYVGAPLARALPPLLIRTLVVATGAIMSVIFFARLAHGQFG